MRHDSRVSFLACNLASPCFGHEPKAKVAIGLSLGSHGTKCHLDVGLVERHKIYYKGEGDGFPPSSGHAESCESEFACGLS